MDIMGFLDEICWYFGFWRRLLYDLLRFEIYSIM